MFKIFGLTIIFSLMIAFMLPAIVIHQVGVAQIVEGKLGDPSYLEFMKDKYEAFRSFKHGALHGFMFGLFMILPITAINGLFEHKSWRHIFITAGYWIVSLTIMGAIICGWK